MSGLDVRQGQPISFGDYTFPELSIIEFHDNFGDANPVLSRLAGIDGAWSEDGQGRAQGVVGQVAINFILFTDEPQQMDDLRDAMRAMVGYGEKKLVYQPTDGGRQRFCWARLNNVSDPRRAQDTSIIALQVSANFQVLYPRWLDGEYLPNTFGDGHTFDDGSVFGDNAYSIAASGTETEDTLTNDGNAETFCAVSIIAGAGNSCANPRIRRYENGAVVDEIKYEGTLSGATQEFFADGIRRIVEVDALDAWSDITYLHPAFMRLASGDNTIKVLFDNVGDAATVRLWYGHCYA